MRYEVYKKVFKL